MFEHSHQVPWSGCWIWDGPVSGDGYAKLVDPRKPFDRASPNRVNLSRLICELTHGEMAHWRYEQARHTCDIPECVNPDHIIPGTPQDNTNDKVSRKRHFITNGLKNGRAKIMPEMIAEIRRLRAGRMRILEIAARYDVTDTTIRSILNGKHWTSAPCP